MTDETNNIVYVCNDKSELLQFDLNSNKIEILSTAAAYSNYPKLFFINNELHIMQDYRHCTFNMDSKQFNQMHKLRASFRISSPTSTSMIYLPEAQR